MTYWITFKYLNARVGARIDGLKVEQWWDDTKLPDVTLEKEYTWEYVSNFHPVEIHQGVFMAAGWHAGNIRELKIFQSDKSWEELK